MRCQHQRIQYIEQVAELLREWRQAAVTWIFRSTNECCRLNYAVRHERARAKKRVWANIQTNQTELEPNRCERKNVIMSCWSSDVICVAHGKRKKKNLCCLLFATSKMNFVGSSSLMRSASKISASFSTAEPFFFLTNILYVIWIIHTRNTIYVYRQNYQTHAVLNSNMLLLVISMAFIKKTDFVRKTFTFTAIYRFVIYFTWFEKTPIAVMKFILPLDFEYATESCRAEKNMILQHIPITFLTFSFYANACAAGIPFSPRTARRIFISLQLSSRLKAISYSMSEILGCGQHENKTIRRTTETICDWNDSKKDRARKDIDREGKNQRNLPNSYTKSRSKLGWFDVVSIMFASRDPWI